MLSDVHCSAAPSRSSSTPSSATTVCDICMLIFKIIVLK
jgi:hypothetical protein